MTSKKGGRKILGIRLDNTMGAIEWYLNEWWHIPIVPVTVIIHS